MARLTRRLNKLTSIKQKFVWKLRRDNAYSDKYFKPHKGRGAGELGQYVKTSDSGLRYIIDPDAVKKFVIPDLSKTELKPYVSPKSEKTSYSFSYLSFFESASSEKSMGERLVGACREASYRLMRFYNTKYTDRFKLY